MWFRSPPTCSSFPFLKPDSRREETRNKLQPKAVRCWYLGPTPNYPRDAMRILWKSDRVVAIRHVTWAHVPTPIYSTPQKAILAPRERENFSGGDGSGEGQAPSPVVKSRPTSSEDDESGGDGHSGGDGTDFVLVYDGVGVGDGLDDLDGTPQKTEEHRQRYKAQLCGFNTKRANRQGWVVETNSSGMADAPSGGEEGDLSLRSSNKGGGSGGNDFAKNIFGGGTSLS